MKSLIILAAASLLATAAFAKLPPHTEDAKAKAADLLGVSRPTLYDLMHRFGLK